MRRVFPSPKQLISLLQLGSKGAVLASSQSWYSMSQWTRRQDSRGLLVTGERHPLLYGFFYKIFNQSCLLFYGLRRYGDSALNFHVRSAYLIQAADRFPLSLITRWGAARGLRCA